MKNILVLLFFAIQSVTCQNIPELTAQEKVSDFTYLIETLKRNYPFFGLYERQYGESWLSKSNIFIKRVHDSRNNKEYLALIDSIVQSLHHKDVDLAPTYHWDFFRTKYGEACLTNPEYIPWVNALNQSEKEISYWNALLEKRNRSDIESKNEVTCKDSLMPELKTGILRISSFDMDKFRDDSQRINEFLYQVSDYNYIIIDIQGNRGGSSLYWMEGIVNRLIYQPTSFNRCFVLKKGKQNSSFFVRYLSDETTNRNRQSLSDLPLEFDAETYKIVEQATTFYPILPIPFKGKIIILTDPVVFSVADEFTYFAQNTSWATIAGETTGGGGIGSDLALIRLPFSGILIRYAALAGLNSDGTLHDEFKTIPDIEITGNTPDERLYKLIRMIKRELR